MRLDPADRNRLTPAEQLDAVFVIFGHLRTQPMATAGAQPWTRPDQVALVQIHANSFSSLAAVATPELRRSVDNGQAFGLECVLDGIAEVHRARS